MKVTAFFKKLIGKKKPTIWQMLHHRIIIIREKIIGLDFTEVIPLNELGLDRNLVVQGSPSGNVYLFQLLQTLQIESKDRILDIGCAKGSAMHVMHKFPFSRIDGVELSDRLSDIAVSNFKNLELESQVFHKNASEFKFYDNYNYYYLYNPFPAVVMQKVIKEIKAQINGSEVKYIIYNNPVCHQILLENGFKKINEFPDLWGNGIYLYSIK